MFYCKYCGSHANSISGLTSLSCSRHPQGGKHALYEGAEKSKYSCKYCGSNANNISGLTSLSCSRRPDGKGKHEPAL